MEPAASPPGKPVAAARGPALLALARSLPAVDVGLVVLSSLLLHLMTAHLMLFLVWVFIAPLALALKRRWARGQLAHLSVLIVLFALLASLLGLWWVGNWGLWMVGLCAAVIAVGGALHFVAIGGALRLIPGPAARSRTLEILAPPLLWTSSIFLLDLTPLGGAFTDISLFHPLAAPLITLVGSRGMTFLIVLTNWTAALFLFHRDRRYLVATAVLLAVPAWTALASTHATVAGRPLKVALVQGNFPQPWAWRVDNVNRVLDRYERLTREALPERPDLVIWPEYALATDFFRNAGISERVGAFAREIGTTLVLGTMTYVDEKRRDYEDPRTDTMLVFSPEGRLVKRYDSARPLPLDTMTVPVGGDPVVRTPRGSFALGVCFEEYAGSAAFGADVDFIVMAANNSRLKKSAGVELAALFSRLRAVENRKFVVRATNTGITQVVDPFGRVAARLRPYRSGVLVFTILI